MSLEKGPFIKLNGEQVHQCMEYEIVPRSSPGPVIGCVRVPAKYPDGRFVEVDGDIMTNVIFGEIEVYWE